MARWLENRGAATDLARKLGITPCAISQWNEVPPARVLDIERITGISRHVLRPDIFGLLGAPLYHGVAPVSRLEPECAE